MFPLQTPTPTPSPSFQVVDVVKSVEHSIDGAVQQGVVGILLLLSIALVLYMIYQIMLAYIQRNKHPDNQGINNAIEALAEMNRNRDREAQLDRDERKADQAEWRKITHDQRESFINSLRPITDGYNRLGDILSRQTTVLQSLSNVTSNSSMIIDAIKLGIDGIATNGSIPLQQLIQTVSEIKASVDAIKDDPLPSNEILGMRAEDRLLFQTQLELVNSEISTIKTKIEEKLKTDTGNIPIISTEDLQNHDT